MKRVPRVPPEPYVHSYPERDWSIGRWGAPAQIEATQPQPTEWQRERRMPPAGFIAAHLPPLREVIFREEFVAFCAAAAEYDRLKELGRPFSPGGSEAAKNEAVRKFREAALKGEPLPACDTSFPQGDQDRRAKWQAIKRARLEVSGPIASIAVQVHKRTIEILRRKQADADADYLAYLERWGHPNAWQCSPVQNGLHWLIATLEGRIRQLQALDRPLPPFSFFDSLVMPRDPAFAAELEEAPKLVPPTPVVPPMPPVDDDDKPSLPTASQAAAIRSRVPKPKKQTP